VSYAFCFPFHNPLLQNHFSDHLLSLFQKIRVADNCYKKGMEAFAQGDIKAANKHLKGAKLYTYFIVQEIILGLRAAKFTVFETLEGHEGDITVMAVANAMSKFFNVSTFSDLN
jgi:hypothetical protein